MGVCTVCIHNTYGHGVSDCLSLHIGVFCYYFLANVQIWQLFHVSKQKAKDFDKRNFFKKLYNKEMKVYQSMNIGILLDMCGIEYSQEQLEKLEKLIENLGIFPKIEETQEEKVSVKVENNDHDDANNDVLDTFHDEANDTLIEPVKSETIQEKSKNECSNCHKVFKTVRMFKKHLAKKCDSHNLCQHCGKVFDSTEQLRTHLRYNHKGTTYFSWIMNDTWLPKGIFWLGLVSMAWDGIDFSKIIADQI